jgi:hypothetical protein
MKWFINDERDYRDIGIDPESSFLNWKNEHGKQRTTALVGRTRKTCQKMNITLKLTKSKMVLRRAELEYKTNTAVGIGRFPTQKILPPEKIEKLIEHKCHGASFTTLKNNEVSNAIRMDPNTRNTDGFFRFVIGGRADCLPTPANLRRWFQDQQVERCQRCQENKTPTFAHIINECRANFQLMTQRHNALASIVRQAIKKHLERDIRSDIRENRTLNEERLSEANRDLRPDLVFERREQERETTRWRKSKWRNNMRTD